MFLFPKIISLIPRLTVGILSVLYNNLTSISFSVSLFLDALYKRSYVYDINLFPTLPSDIFVVVFLVEAICFNLILEDLVFKFGDITKYLFSSA